MDDYLTAMIPLVEDHVKEYCNQAFTDAEGKPSFPGGVQIAIAKMCQYHMKNNTVQSEALSRHNVTYATEYPPEITRLLNNYRRPKFV